MLDKAHDALRLGAAPNKKPRAERGFEDSAKALSLLLSVLAQSGDLCSHHSQFRLCACQIDIALGIFDGLFCCRTCCTGFFVVQIFTPDSRIRQNRYTIWLNLKNAARNEDKLFATIGHLDAH